jgi:hypothetical protein
VLVQQIDTVRLKPAQRVFNDFTDVCWSTIEAHDTAILDLETELGRDDDTIAPPIECATEQLLVCVRPVNFRRVEERYAEIDSTVDGSDGLTLVALFGRAVGSAHTHTSEPESRNFQVAVAEFARLHDFCLCLVLK